MPDMTGRVALISGGARGMGASHARGIVDAGGKVVIGDVLDADGEITAKELGDAAIYTHLDVTKLEDWQAAVDLAVTTFGVLNVLVNNAGIVNNAPFAEYTEEQWRKVLDINLTGPFLGMKAALQALTDSAPSAVVNISSVAGMFGNPGSPGYAASKFGVRGLTRTLATELGPRGIRCNSVHPGVIQTPMTAGMFAAEDAAPVGALERPGRPQDVTKVVLFLASEDSSYCTGSEFVVDGGLTASLTLPDE